MAAWQLTVSHATRTSDGYGQDCTIPGAAAVGAALGQGRCGEHGADVKRPQPGGCSMVGSFPRAFPLLIYV